MLRGIIIFPKPRRDVLPLIFPEHFLRLYKMKSLKDTYLKNTCLPNTSSVFCVLCPVSCVLFMKVEMVRNPGVLNIYPWIASKLP